MFWGKDAASWSMLRGEDSSRRQIIASRELVDFDGLSWRWEEGSSGTEGSVGVVGVVEIEGLVGAEEVADLEGVEGVEGEGEGKGKVEAGGVEEIMEGSGS